MPSLIAFYYLILWKIIQTISVLYHCYLNDETPTNDFKNCLPDQFNEYYSLLRFQML